MRESEIPGGIKGLWYRLSGKAARIERANQDRKNQAAYEQYQHQLQDKHNNRVLRDIKKVLLTLSV